MASIRKRGNSYQITVSNGRDINDKQILVTTTWKPDPNKTDKQNQKALDRFVMDFEDRVLNGKYLDGEKVSFQEFSERWLNEYANTQLEKTTVDIYKFLLNIHIIPSIGHLKLAKVQPSHLNKLYADMLQCRKDGKEGGYSPTTIKRVHALISSILSTAVQWNIILNNPCERIKPPKQARNMDDVKFFTPEEAAAFLEELDRETKEGRIKLQHNIFFQLSLFCGLRRGEVVALLWSDIDFKNKTVSISKSTSIVNGKPYTKSPKNKTSNRIISIPEHIVAMLKQHHIEYNKYKLSLGSHWEGTEYLFIQENGLQMYPSTPYAVFKDVLHRYNQEHPEEPLPDIPLHGLRHTSATLLISQNIDIRTVSNRLGHAQTSTTMNIYSHALQSMDEKAADTLENMLVKKSC